jgi:hypothetical protein
MHDWKVVRLVDDDGSWKWSVFSDMDHALCRIEDMDIDDSWKKIWKLKVPERVRMFVWWMHHERILTNFHKSRMGLG